MRHHRHLARRRDPALCRRGCLAGLGLNDLRERGRNWSRVRYVKITRTETTPSLSRHVLGCIGSSYGHRVMLVHALWALRWFTQLAPLSALAAGVGNAACWSVLSLSLRCEVAFGRPQRWSSLLDICCHRFGISRSWTNPIGLRRDN